MDDGSVVNIAQALLTGADIPSEVDVQMLNALYEGPVFRSNSSILISVTPRKDGSPCWALNTSISFNITDSLLRGTFGTLAERAAPSWLLPFSLSEDTGPGWIDFVPPAVSPVRYWADGIPDQARVTCPATPQPSGVWFDCTVDLLRAGDPVHALSSVVRGIPSVSLSTTAPAVAPWPYVATSFALPFVVGSFPVAPDPALPAYGTAAALIEGASGVQFESPPTNVSVAFQPDTSSTLACFPKQFDTASQSFCTYTARRRSMRVLTAAELEIRVSGPIVLAGVLGGGTGFGNSTLEFAVRVADGTGTGPSVVSVAIQGASSPVASFSVTACGIPDAVEVILPPAPFPGVRPVYEADTALTITARPLRGGVHIYALNSSITASIGGVQGSIGNLLPVATNAWSWVFSLGHDSGPGDISFNPPSTQPIIFIVSGIPDSGNVSCPPAIVAANSTVTCTVAVGRDGAPLRVHVMTLSSTFKRSIASVEPPATLSADSTDSEFTMEVQAAAEPLALPLDPQTRPAYGTVGALFGGALALIPTEIEIAFEPDLTSGVICASRTFDIAAQLRCTFISRRRGVPVRSLYSFEPSASGAISISSTRPASPIGEGNWTFEFTLISAAPLGGPGWVDMNMAQPNGSTIIATSVIVATGVPDATSAFNCSTNVTWIGSAFTCELAPALSHVNVYTVPGTLELAWPFMPRDALLAAFGDEASIRISFAVYVGEMQLPESVSCTGLCGLSLAAPGRGVIASRSILVLARPARDASTLTCPTLEASANTTITCTLEPRVLVDGPAVVSDARMFRAIATPSSLADAWVEPLPTRLATGSRDANHTDLFSVVIRFRPDATGTLRLSVHPLLDTGSPLAATVRTSFFVSGMSVQAARPQWGTTRGGVPLTIVGSAFPLAPEPLSVAVCGAQAPLVARSTTYLFVRLPPLAAELLDAGTRVCDVAVSLPDRPGVPPAVLAAGYEYNVPPVAVFEPFSDDVVYLPGYITLNASRSYDPDTAGAAESVLRFSWRVVEAPEGAESVSLASGSASVAFAGPLYASGLYAFELTVTDNGGDSVAATLNVSADYLPSLDVTIRIDTEYDPFKQRYRAEAAFREDVWNATAESLDVRPDQLAVRAVFAFAVY
eukprot:tig00020902_g14976.t1